MVGLCCRVTAGYYIGFECYFILSCEEILGFMISSYFKVLFDCNFFFKKSCSLWLLCGFVAVVFVRVSVVLLFYFGIS